MASFTMLSCFAAVKYDTNSANWEQREVRNLVYYTDKTYYQVRRRLTLYHGTAALNTIVRVEADNTPQYVHFLVEYGQSVYYKSSQYNTVHNPRTEYLNTDPNSADYTSMDLMKDDFMEGIALKKLVSWYNCQPRTDSGKVIADNHYCIITKTI